MRFVARLAIFASIVVALATVFGPGLSSAQIPDKYKNLKVLPKDISKSELVDVMKSFSHALGVRCTECHVSTKPGSNRLEDLDFASDDKQDKKTAREMMRMVSTINTQIDKIGLKDPARVGCVTCHHGVKEPRTLGAVMMKSIEKDGVTGAVDQYRKLRESYYGSAAYDFSADALTEVASDLADSKKDYDGALSLVRLNLEFNPKDVNSYVLMGRLQLAKGDKAGGIASYEKALELDPEHRWAKQQLERAKSGE